MKNLFILWRHLHGDSSYGEDFLSDQRELLMERTNEELIDIAKILCQEGNLEHFPQEYAVYVSADAEEFRTFKTDRDWQIIYEGTIENYREFLIAVASMLYRIENPTARCKFVVDLALQMPYLNQEAANKFANDLANEAHYSIK